VVPATAVTVPPQVLVTQGCGAISPVDIVMGDGPGLPKLKVSLVVPAGGGSHWATAEVANPITMSAETNTITRFRFLNGLATVLRIIVLSFALTVLVSTHVWQ
jgi:hypothetical protein